MPWQPTLASARLDEETPEKREERNAREIQQARLTWQTRKGRSLELTVRWRRFYAKHKHCQESLQRIEREIEARIKVLTVLTEKPERHTSGGMWTQAMERLEDREAELSAVRACLKAGG